MSLFNCSGSYLDSDDLWHIPWMEESVRNSLINHFLILESDVLICSTDMVDSNLKKKNPPPNR